MCNVVCSIFCTNFEPYSTAKSPLGWGLVGYMEADPDLIKEVHGFDIEELRSEEKNMMQHNREIAAATRGKSDRPGGAGRGSRGNRDKDAGQHGGGASAPYSAKKRRRGGDNSVTCYECNGNAYPFLCLFVTIFSIRGGPQILRVPQEGEQAQEGLDQGSHWGEDDICFVLIVLCISLCHVLEAFANSLNKNLF